jgi:hypothetical protein
MKHLPALIALMLAGCSSSASSGNPPTVEVNANASTSTTTLAPGCRYDEPVPGFDLVPHPRKSYEQTATSRDD